MEREFDCEYTDGPTPSLTQVLEKNVTRLEARIKELEALEAEGKRSRKSPTASTSNTSLAPSAGPGISQGIDPNENVVSSDPKIEPHPAIVHLLVSIFVPYASQVGFFLNFARFLDAVYSPDATSRRALLSPTLLDAVLLWGAHLSTNESLRAHENTFLSRAVKSVADAIPQVSAQRHNAIHLIQAEVLLSNYFFCQARELEGTYHCSAAVSLALSCRLNLVRSLTTDTTGILPLPVDAIEEGEKINAFWAVYTLDRSWSVAQGSLSSDVFVGVRIDTPWPVEMGSYEDSGLSPDIRGSNTILNFFNDPHPELTMDGLSALALRAKGAALFEKATRLASQWTPGMVNFDAYYLEVFQVDNLIRRFAETLLPLTTPEVTANPEITANLIVTHTFACVSAIRLHSNFDIIGAATNPTGLSAGIEKSDLIAARAAVVFIDSVHLEDLPFLDPIVAVLWYTVCKVFVDAIVVNPAVRQDLVISLRKVMHAMAKYAPLSPLMSVRLNQIRQDFSRLGSLIPPV
ncbi:hypothetical protein C8Q75DRAFT_97432 [Abortiporus biennis]|nr:hypothetical protein C8Q75DRAFT_97432 [Abortiporus biennis]